MILISGGSGFIGRNILAHLPVAQNLSLRSDNWREQIAENRVVINLVGKAHDHTGSATENDYYHANVTLAKEIFNAFKDSSSAELLVHVSSIAALEEFDSNFPLMESDSTRPQSWYGKSKRAAEEWLLSQELPPNKKLIILRPPLVHGPGDKGNLGLLYKLISKGIPYPLASFDNRRSFISIDNFCYLIEKIIEQRIKLESGIYHIADDEPLSTKEIIETIKYAMGKHVVNIALPKFLVKWIAKVGDFVPIPLNSKRLTKMTSNLLVSNTKIKRALGIKYLPLNAKKGLEKTIRSFL